MGLAQVSVLLAQPAQFLDFGGGRVVVAFAVVGLGLADPVAALRGARPSCSASRRITGLGSDSR